MFRRRFMAATTIATALALAGPAAAHHGWLWAENENFELTGTVKSARLGNPHGLVTVEAKGETWTIEVGQPWRNARAGLTDAMFAPGESLTARGHRATDKTQKLMKAERLVIRGKTYDLYPDRD